MQVLVYQARLCDLKMQIQGSKLTLGQSVELAFNDDQSVAAFVMQRSGLPFGLGKPRRQLLGQVISEVAEIIAPALLKNVPLRVRIVEIKPAHTRTDGVDQISISIWGEPSALLDHTAVVR